MTDFVTRCAYCKSIVEHGHARTVDFTPTGRMIVFHDTCKDRRGKEPAEAVGDERHPVTRIRPKISVPATRKADPDDYGYDD